MLSTCDMCSVLATLYQPLPRDAGVHSSSSSTTLRLRFLLSLPGPRYVRHRIVKARNVRTGWQVKFRKDKHV